MGRSPFQLLLVVRERRETRARKEWSTRVAAEERQRVVRETAHRQLVAQQDRRTGYAQSMVQEGGTTAALDQLARRVCLERLDGEVREGSAVLGNAEKALTEAARATSVASGQLNAARVAKEKMRRCLETITAAANRERSHREEMEFDDDAEAFGTRQWASAKHARNR
jgi:hypothetical protein